MESFAQTPYYAMLFVLLTSLFFLTRGWRKFQEFAIASGNKKLKQEAEIFRFATIAFMILLSILVILILNRSIANLVHRAIAYFDTSISIAIFLTILGFLGKIKLRSITKNQAYSKWDIFMKQVILLFIGSVIATFIIMTNEGITIKQIVEAHYK
jgi:hypothetical protein